jgi:hypothetical protein
MMRSDSRRRWWAVPAWVRPSLLVPAVLAAAVGMIVGQIVTAAPPKPPDTKELDACISELWEFGHMRGGVSPDKVVQCVFAMEEASRQLKRRP